MAKNSRFDTATYEEAKTHLKAAFEHLITAGRDVRELIEFVLEKSGDTFTPYLRRFLSDVHEGRIKIEGLGKSAKQGLLGPHITAEERQAMIREAAYLRAEQRGFAGGSPEEDWVLAEREIDERLAQQSGLITKGRQALTSATSSVEQELGSMRDIITRWLEDSGAVAKKPKTKKASKKKKSGKTKAAKTASKKTAKKKAKGK